MSNITVRLADGGSQVVRVPDGMEVEDFMKTHGKSLYEFIRKSTEPEIAVSEHAIDLIKSQEAFSPTPYEDQGSLSIGYGTRGGINPNDKVTEAQADGLLRSHLNDEVVPWIKSNIKTKLSQNQIDSLSSLIYNVGVGNFNGTRAHEALNEGKTDVFIREAFSRDRGFTKATEDDGTKRTLPGLVGRREKERQLFAQSTQPTMENK